MKTFISAMAAGLLLSPWTVSAGSATEAAISRDLITPAQYPVEAAPNRLDFYDLKRELAREAEHRRIRTRLGDPDRGCQTVVVGGRGDAVTPAVVIVCR
jgi:hypothetical protein